MNEMKTPVRRAAPPAPKDRFWRHGDIMRFFPEGKTPRSQQVEAITKIDQAYKDGARIVLLEQPTGGGKSFVADTFARATRAAGGSTHFLTAQKILQDQYERDFPSPEMELIKGRNAYPCNHEEAVAEQKETGRKVMCDDAPCHANGKSILQVCCGQTPKKDVTDLVADPAGVLCPYWKQLLTAAQSPVTLFNFSSFLFQQRAGRFGDRDLLIIDEAHNCEGQILNFVSLSMHEGQTELLGEALPDFANAEAIAEWIREKNLVRRADIASEDKHRSVKDRETLERLKFKFETFLEYIELTEWVVENVPATFKFKKSLKCRPVYAFDFADNLLFRRGKRVLAVSATILSKDIWAQSLGLPSNEVAIIQLGSDFPIENRPIKREFLGNMNYNNKADTLPRLIEWIKKTLLPNHQGERGIIHAHSFDIAKAIVAGVGSPRLLLHESGQDKRDVLATHAGRSDSVIVAPAFHEGVDLKDDLSRFQVLAKVPYPNMGDKVVGKRMNGPGGQNWYMWNTLLKVVQSYGRSVRSAEDHAVTYLTDSGFGVLLSRAGRLLPKWFKEALV